MQMWLNGKALLIPTLSHMTGAKITRHLNKKKAERLLDVVEKKFPSIRECIQSYYVATPLSYRDYQGSSDGSMYGIEKDYRNSVKNVYPA